MHSIKKNMVTIGGVVILMLLVISFVFTPALSGRSGGTGKEVLGRWKKKALENTQDGIFIRQYRQLYHNAEQRGYLTSNGNEFQKKFIEQQVMHAAFNASMIELASQQEVSDAGFYVPNDAINKALIPFYSDATGTYSAKLYQQTSEQEKLARRKTVTEYITAQRYVEDLFGTEKKIFGLKMSSGEKDFIRRMTERQRSFDYVVFEESRFPVENIQKYGEKHADMFAEHHLKMLTFTAEDEANKILQAIQKKELTFDDAVAANSTKQGTDSSGALLSPYRTTVNKTFPEASALDTVLKLKAGETSAVLKTASGFAIVVCTADATPADFSQKDVQDRVFSYMKANERGIIEDYLEEQAKTFITAVKKNTSKDAFVKTAEKDAFVVQTSSPLVINYGNVSLFPQISGQSDTAFTSAARNDIFFKTAFGLTKNQVSDPVILDSNVVVLTLAQETDTVDEVREKAAKTYEQYASYWYYDFPMALFGFQKLPWGQQTLVDFVLNSKHFTNKFNDFIR